MDGFFYRNLDSGAFLNHLTANIIFFYALKNAQEWGKKPFWIMFQNLSSSKLKKYQASLSGKKDSKTDSLAFF